jgi:hypothetical protein
MGQIQPRSEKVDGVQPAAAPAEGGPQLGQSMCLDEFGRRARDHLHRFLQQRKPFFAS